MGKAPTKTNGDNGNGNGKSDAIKPDQPYPTGNPPDDEEAFFQAHGYRRDKKEKEDK
jgi:hypothetical protein